MLSQQNLVNVCIAGVDIDRLYDHHGIFLHGSGMDVRSVPGGLNKVLHNIVHALGVVVCVIPVGAVKRYSVQIDGFPFELRPTLGQLTSTSSGSIYVPGCGSDVLFDFHFCLNDGGSLY